MSRKKKKHDRRGNKQVTAARQETGIPAQLYGRREIIALTGLTYPTLWDMTRRGEFPRGRIVGGQTKWLASEIDMWLSSLPTRPLKGDAPASPETA